MTKEPEIGEVGKEGNLNVELAQYCQIVRTRALTVRGAVQAIGGASKGMLSAVESLPPQACVCCGCLLWVCVDDLVWLCM
jgi:hypothetical protein